MWQGMISNIMMAFRPITCASVARVSLSGSACLQQSSADGQLHNLLYQAEPHDKSTWQSGKQGSKHANVGNRLQGAAGRCFSLGKHMQAVCSCSSRPRKMLKHKFQRHS